MRMLFVAAPLVAALVALPCAAAPQPWRFSAESDPVDFVSHGFALYLGVKPADTRLRLGLGTFTLDFPQFVVDASAGESGWSVRAQRTALAYASWYFAEDRRGFFLGARAFSTELRYRYAPTGGEGASRHYFAGPEVGYQWFPFGEGFYVTPWLGGAFDLARSDEPGVPQRRFPGGRFLPLAFVYFGYEL